MPPGLFLGGLFFGSVNELLLSAAILMSGLVLESLR